MKLDRLSKLAEDLSRRSVHAPSEELSDFGTYDYQPVTIAIQQHDAARRGRHYDLRIITPDRSLSFVTPWSNLENKPGEKASWIRMPDHTKEYGTWSGQIPEGEYGAGYVQIIWTYPGVLHTDDKNQHHLTYIDGKKAGKITFSQKKNDPRRFFAVTRNLPQERYWQERPQYKQKTFEDAENAAGFMASEKRDGALVYLNLTPRGITVTSRRKSKRTGDLLAREHHVPWIRDIKVPKKYQGLALGAEMQHPEGFMTTGPLMNMLPENAVRKQQDVGRMNIYLHSVMNRPDLTGRQKVELLKEVQRALGNEYVRLPEYSEDPAKLLNAVRGRGGEGIIMFKPEEIDPQLYKVKFRPTFTGKVIGFEKGRGKNKDRLGAMIVQDSKGNTVRVGGGPGMTQNMRQDIWDNQNDFMGRRVRISASGPTGHSLRQPMFEGWDIEERPLDIFEK